MLAADEALQGQTLHPGSTMLRSGRSVIIRIYASSHMHPDLLGVLQCHAEELTMVQADMLRRVLRTRQRICWR